MNVIPGCAFILLPSGRCHIRVIDTFGTEPPYNHEEYATLNGYRTNWGYWNLNCKQFMTMFRRWRTFILKWLLNVEVVATIMSLSSYFIHFVHS